MLLHRIGGKKWVMENRSGQLELSFELGRGDLGMNHPVRIIGPEKSIYSRT
jgi:hypothetical protein